MQEKTKHTIIISILSALILGLGVGYIYYNKQDQDVLAQQHSIKIDTKKQFYDQVTPEQVGEYQKALEVNNLGVRATGAKETEIIADLTVKYSGKPVFTNLISFNLNKDKMVSGGEFYAKN